MTLYKLTEFDIPAVIGMQFEISDAAAIAFSQALYDSLAQGLPVDAAMAPARRAILAVHTGIAFGTPVHFLRATESRLFDLEPPSQQLHVAEPAIDESVAEGQATTYPRALGLGAPLPSSIDVGSDGRSARDSRGEGSDRAAELIIRGMKARSWRLTGPGGTHEIHYRLKSITEELVVDGERTVTSGGLGKKPITFNLKEGGREIPGQLYVRLKWDNFAVARAEMIIEGRSVYTE